MALDFSGGKIKEGTYKPPGEANPNRAFTGTTGSTATATTAQGTYTSTGRGAGVQTDTTFTPAQTTQTQQQVIQQQQQQQINAQQKSRDILAPLQYHAQFSPNNTFRAITDPYGQEIITPQERYNTYTEQQKQQGYNQFMGETQQYLQTKEIEFGRKGKPYLSNIFGGASAILSPFSTKEKAGELALTVGKGVVIGGGVTAIGIVSGGTATPFVLVGLGAAAAYEVPKIQEQFLTAKQSGAVAYRETFAFNTAQLAAMSAGAVVGSNIVSSGYTVYKEIKFERKIAKLDVAKQTFRYNPNQYGMPTMEGQQMQLIEKGYKPTALTEQQPLELAKGHGLKGDMQLNIYGRYTGVEARLPSVEVSKIKATGEQYQLISPVTKESYFKTSYLKEIITSKKGQFSLSFEKSMTGYEDMWGESKAPSGLELKESMRSLDYGTVKSGFDFAVFSFVQQKRKQEPQFTQLQKISLVPALMPMTITKAMSASTTKNISVQKAINIQASLPISTPRQKSNSLTIQQPKLELVPETPIFGFPTPTPSRPPGKITPPKIEEIFKMPDLDFDFGFGMPTSKRKKGKKSQSLFKGMKMPTLNVVIGLTRLKTKYPKLITGLESRPFPNERSMGKALPKIKL